MVALASCDHQKSKLRAVAGAEGFWVAELRVRQLKIGSKSCSVRYLLLCNKVAVVSCDHPKSKLRAVGDVFWVVEL